jgi:tetratricopeptide (TPR) repeat protein
MQRDPAMNTLAGAARFGCERSAPSFCRGVIRCIGLMAILTTGCSTTAGAARPSTGQADDRHGGTVPAAGGIDPERAFVSLDQLEPRIDSPKRPESLAPLSQRSAAQITRAFERADQQRFTEASNELERALRYDPDHPEIHRALAEVNHRAGNLQRTKTHAARAIEGNPDDARSHYLLGIVLESEQDHDGAIRSLRTALVCGDAEGIATRCYSALAGALAGGGYLQAALDAYGRFERARALRGDAPPGGGSGAPVLSATFQVDLLEKLGRWSEAADALPAGAADRDVVLRRVGLLIEADRLDEALAAVRGIARPDARSLDLLERVHRRRGTEAEALDDVRTWLAETPDADALIALCDWLTQRGHGARAEAALAGFIETHPDSPEVRGALIESLIASSASQRALEAVAGAIRLHPAESSRWQGVLSRIAKSEASLDAQLAAAPDDDYAITYVKGAVVLEAGRLAEAETLLRRSHTLDAGFVPARAALGQLYLHAHQYAEAIEVAGREDPDLAEHAALERVLGRAYERLDESDPAELHLKAAIQLDPEDVDSMHLLAMLYHRTQRMNLAHQRLQAVVAIDPAHERARELLSRLLILSRRRDEAIRQYDELIKASESPAVRARAAAWMSLVTDADAKKFRSMLEQAIADGYDDERTWLALGDSFRVDGEFDLAPAREAFRNAWQRNPQSEAAVLGLIDAEWSALNFEEVIRLWEHILPLRPNRHEWRLGGPERPGLLDAMLALREIDAALEMLRARIDRGDLPDATRDAYREAIRDALWEFDRKDEALAAVTQWAAEENPPGDWSKRLALVLLARDRAVDAIPLLEKMRADDPADAWVAGRLRDALVAAERFEQADQLALDRLFEDPDNDEAMGFMVQTLAGEKRYDDAIELVRNKIAHSIRRTAYQELLIDLLSSAERYEEANDLTLSVIDDLIEHFRGDMEEVDHFRRRLASQLILLSKDYMEAERLLARWVEEATGPRSRFEYLVLLAACLEFQERADDAQRVKLHAIAIRPLNVGLNNDVAYGWIDQGMHLDRAEPMIRFAVARSPRESAYLDTYGWLLYKKGRFDQARTWLARAHAGRDSADPVILDHLGDACWRAGARDEAVAHWRAALEAVDALEDGPRNADDQRVRHDAKEKIDAVEAGDAPPTAALEVEAPTTGDEDGAATGDEDGAKTPSEPRP